jgi:nucleoside-diphosphate-sugar epimerase
LTKARKELGFEPQIGYDEAAKEIVEDYKARSYKEEEEVAEEQSEDQA